MKNHILSLIFIPFVILYAGCGPDKPPGNEDPVAVCGDSKRSGSEKCDTAITSGYGMCPDQARCDKELALKPFAERTCKRAEVTGTGCEQTCSFVEINKCNAVKDGCCPSGCHNLNDPDCNNDAPPGYIKLGDHCSSGKAEENCNAIISGKPRKFCRVAMVFDTSYYPSLCTAPCNNDSDCAGGVKPMKCSNSHGAGVCHYSCDGTNNPCPKGYECSTDNICEPYNWVVCKKDSRNCTDPDKLNGEFGNTCAWDADFSNSSGPPGAYRCMFSAHGTAAIGQPCTTTADCDGGSSGLGDANLGVMCIHTEATQSQGKCFMVCNTQDQCKKLSIPGMNSCRNIQSLHPELDFHDLENLEFCGP